jgi:hypothetical protein
MIGHPAIAYLVAQNMLDERRREARNYHLAKTVSGSRTLRLGNYRLTITKEVAHVPRTV